MSAPEAADATNAAIVALAMLDLAEIAAHQLADELDKSHNSTAASIGIALEGVRECVRDLLEWIQSSGRAAS